MAKILVVDDQPTNRKVLVALMTCAGHEAIEASDGSVALEQVRAQRPDLVVCDILMPTMDGYEFVRQLRAEPAIANTAVIFYTATFLEHEARNLALSCGVSQVLLKPCKSEQVLQAIDRALGCGRPAEPPADEATFDREHRRLLADKLVQKADQLERANQRLSALTELNLQLASERDPGVLLDKVCRGARDLIGARYAILGVKDTAQSTPTIITTSGMADADAERVKQQNVDVDDMPRQVMRERKPRRFCNPGGDPLAVGLLGAYPPVHSCLIAPIVSLKQAHGWILLIDKLGAESFGEDDERLLAIHAAQAGRIYENGSLYLEMQHSADKLQDEIIERQAAAERLRESELRFRQLAENISEVFFLVSADFAQVLYISPAYEEIWGRSCESLNADPLSWMAAIHPDDLDTARRGIEERDEAGQFAYECRIVRPDGSLRWISTRGFPIRDEGGVVYRIAGIAEDISKQAGLQQELREREAGLRHAQTLAKLAHVITRPDGSFESWSESLPKLLGIDANSVPESTRDWLTTLHPEDRALFRETSIQAAVAGKATCLDYRLQRSDGGWVHVHQEIEPLMGRGDANGNLRWFSTLQDVTEQKRAEQDLRESERRFGDMLGNVQLVSMMVDREARITYANDYLLQLTGWRREEVLGKDWFELFVPPEMADLKGVHAAVLAGDPSGAHQLSEIVNRSGERRLIQWNNSVLRSGSGEPIGAASIGEDVTDRKVSEEKIRRLNRVYAVLSGINTLIVRVHNRDDLFRGSCRIAVEAGAYELAWVGVVDPDALDGRVVAWHGDGGSYVTQVRLTLHDDGPHSDRPANRALRRMEPVICNDIAGDPSLADLSGELLARGLRSLACFPLIVDGRAMGVLTLCSAETNAFDEQELALLLELASDISFALDHLQQAEKLNRLAYYDALTGLANSSLLNERLTQAIAAAGAGQQVLALAMIDLERFETVNHSFGRHGGDALLKQVAERLGKNARVRTQFARIDADHFAVLLPDALDAAEVGRMFDEKYRRWFTPPFQLEGRELRVAAKIGIALYPNDGGDAETLYRNAEAALKKAKDSSDRVLFYDPRMTEAVAERLALEGQLRLALERDEFVLHYQPKVDVVTRHIAGVEALIRWNSPVLGLVPPLKFISLLEETGLIVDVGLWALGRAALDHAAWREQGLAAPRIAVNVSAVQLLRPDFVDAVRALLSHCAPPHGIDLELTESLVMEDIESNIGKLHALRSLGMDLAIDDFGTGYSSLAYLSRLPAQTLKIDRAFVMTMLDDPNNMTLVSTMISLAHSLRMEVVAEGVETEEQAKMLRLLRCDLMQGFLISRPVPFDAMSVLLGEQGIASKAAFKVGPKESGIEA